MNVVEKICNDDKKLFVYIQDNVEIYYEDGFKIQVLEDSMISVVHTYDEFFKVVMTHDNIICDYVLTCVVEVNENKKSKISCEMGVDDRASGFFTHMVDCGEIYPIFFTTYSREELDEAAGLVPLNI